MPPDALLFLDVDGVLIPFRDRPAPPGPGPSPDDGGHPLLHRLDPSDGRRLLALDAELVWATTWMAEANAVIAPRLGLPQLPFVDWPDDDDIPAPGLHWKTVLLVRWAAARPFVWLDDEITPADREWVAAHHPAPALLHRVDARAGLTAPDFATITAWLSSPRTADAAAPPAGQ